MLASLESSCGADRCCLRGTGGALACPLVITVLHETQPEAEEDEEEGEDEQPVFTFSGPQTLAGYSTTTVNMRFAPRRAGDAACLYRIAFANLSPDEEVSVHGLGVQVPIFLEREVLDLQCCAFDGLYRENLVCSNRSKVSRKVQLRVPRELDGFLEFVPSMGYVQAKSSFTAGLKQLAAEELLEACAAYISPSSDGSVLEVPVSIAVPEQVLPVSFVLKFQLTTPQLLLERGGEPVERLHFGPCPLSATKVLTLTLRNPSALPQRFGFVPLPKEIDVQPGDGLGTILPGEAITRQLRFTPTAATMQPTRRRARRRARRMARNLAKRRTRPWHRFQPSRS